MRVLAVILLLLVSGCIVIKKSPAPGCVTYFGPAPMGGCFGKALIRDLKVEPQLDCLQVTVNNCNGGILTVANRCDSDLLIGGYTLRRGPHPESIELLRAADGGVYVNRTVSNFAAYRPLEDDSLTLAGSIGGSKVTLSYVKTKPYC